MAQIVTITNPLTGQPAQVDQLDHTAQQIDDAIARALPGGDIDIALANNDPRQWGLGLNGPPSTDDCDTATKNGWYHVYGATLNKPFGKVGALLVVCRGATQMYQLFFVGETYSTGGSCIIVRSMYGGTWGPWEWVNPPMEVGVEYRTTERYMGKPVYVKVVDFGNYPASGTKTVAHGISNVKNIVSCLGTSSMGYSVNGFQYVDYLYADTANVYITVNADVSKNQVKVILKYTKTTD